MRIAFDIDDTLWKLVEDFSPRSNNIGAMCACGMPLTQVPDETLIALAHSLTLDHEVFIWSAGGVEYAKNWIKKFAPAWLSIIQIIPKERGHSIDICFDDQDVDLAKINVRIKREHSEHYS